MAFVIVLPTRNEAAIIRANLEQLLSFLHHQSPDAYFHDRRNRRLDSQGGPKEGGQSASPETPMEDWRVIVADNGSTDTTRAIVRDIAAAEPRVELLEIPEAGKGGAVLRAWWHAESRIKNQESRDPNDTFVFMDADLATDLKHLPDLTAAIRNGADVAVGSRYTRGAETQRGALRRVTSWCYRVLLRLLFGLRVSDPPCGFKAVNARVVREIVPLVRDRQWFFDTELCIRAQRAGLRIAEIPVTWHEPRRDGSLGKVLRIIAHDLRAMMRLLCERRS